MKKLCFALACAFLCSTAVMAQTAPNMPEKAVERMQQKMTEKYSKMNPEQLTRRKEMIEKRLAGEQNERAKQRLQVELDTVNSLIQK